MFRLSLIDFKNTLAWSQHFNKLTFFFFNKAGYIEGLTLKALKYWNTKELKSFFFNLEKEQHTWKIFIIYAYASKVWIDINLLLERRLFILWDFKL